MGDVIPANFGGASSRFATVKIENDAAAGIGASYAVVTYRGKAWKTKYRGEEKIVMRPDGDGPANSIEVVILMASAVKSKLYYPGYVDGANNRPACWSSNGVTPDPRAESKQANACAICPRAVRGSKVDENGQARGSECRDNKRVAIVPLGDLENDLLGGPMLLRIPAASLNAFAEFTTKLEKMGVPYCGAGIKISFDPTEAYPKFVFQAVRPLTDDEADIVLSLRDSMQVKRIISEDIGDTTPALPAPDQVFAQPGEVSPKFSALKEKVAAPPPPPAAPKKAAAKKPEPEVVVEDAPVTTGTSIDDELEALLG